MPANVPVSTASSRYPFANIEPPVHVEGAGQVQLLLTDSLEPQQQLEAKSAAEGERHLGLGLAVDIGAVNLGVGAVAEHALDHGGNL